MHPQRSLIEQAKQVPLFLNRPQTPYYGSDLMGEKAHQEHMKWRLFRPYVEAFQAGLDDHGQHSRAHRDGMDAIEEFKKQNPRTNIEPRLIDKF